MEVQQGRGVKDESKIYGLNDKNKNDNIVSNILVWGKEKACIWFFDMLISYLDNKIDTCRKSFWLFSMGAGDGMHGPVCTQHTQ